MTRRKIDRIREKNERIMAKCQGSVGHEQDMSGDGGYFCEKCGRRHYKGKVYEDHVNYAVFENEVE